MFVFAKCGLESNGIKLICSYQCVVILKVQSFIVGEDSDLLMPALLKALLSNWWWQRHDMRWLNRWLKSPSVVVNSNLNAQKYIS